MNSLLLFFVCVSLTVFIIYKQRKCWFFIWQLNGWQGLVQQPILWLLLIIYLEPKSIMTSIQRCSKFFQFPLAIIVFNRILLYVDDPETMENVLNAPECLNKTFLQNGFFANKGLLHAKDEQWKIRRKQLNPAFSHNTLVSFFGAFNRGANEMQFQINKDFQGDNVNYKDLEDLITRTVLQVSCLTTMGFPTNFTQNDDKCIAKAYRYLMELTALRILKPWYQSDFIFWLLDKENYEKSNTANKLVDEFVANIVLQKHIDWQERQTKATKGLKLTGMERSEACKGKECVVEETNEHSKNNKITFATTSTASDAYRNMAELSLPATEAFMQQQQQRCFIDQIFYLAQTGKLTLQDVMNESQSMVVVSFETISTCVINALLCLAINHECQMKLRQEIKQKLSKRMSNKFGTTTMGITSIKHNNDANVTNTAGDGDGGGVDFESDAATSSSTVGDCAGVHVTMEHLQSMPYLDMIINESLRLLTTVPMNLRNVSTDFQLQVLQRDKETSKSKSKSNSNSKNNCSDRSNNRTYRRCVVVPKDTMIALDTFNMQRNKEFWGESALKFVPEHFAKKHEHENKQEELKQQQQQRQKQYTNETKTTSENTTSSRHSYAFIPFSKGLRTCIGYRYSIYLSKIILIKLISSFEFATEMELEDLQYYEGVSLKFRNAEQIHFQIHPVD